MKPLQRSYLQPEKIKLAIREYTEAWKRGEPDIRELFPAADLSAANASITFHFQEMLEKDVVWKNEQYQVNVRHQGEFVHLSIKRNDKKPVRDWRDMQAIKNQLVGPECEGVELFPAESRVVDTANQFHLWCFASPKHRFPLGFNQGRVVTNGETGGSRQRPRT